MNFPENVGLCPFEIRSCILYFQLKKILNCHTVPGEVIYIDNDDVTIRFQKPLNVQSKDYGFRIIITALESGNIFLQILGKNMTDT